MLFRHPGVARIDCRDCCKREYDFEKGVPLVACKTADGKELYYDDPGFKPRCMRGEECPRGNPTEGPSHDLGPLQQEILSEFLVASKVGFRNLTQEQLDDGLLMDCFYALASLKEECDLEAAGIRSKIDLIEVMAAMRGAPLNTKGNGRR